MEDRDEILILLREIRGEIRELRERLAPLMAGTYHQKDAASMLGICPKTFRDYITLYRLPVRQGRGVRYTWDDLRVCADILRKAGKLRRGTVFSPVS